MKVRKSTAGRLTVWIDGREALPVRAIPYVTKWQLSPDLIADCFARHQETPIPRLRDLSAHLLGASKWREVRPREWDTVLVELAGLEAQLRKQLPEMAYAAWRREAALKLPVSVFVWLDEFQRAYERDRAEIERADVLPGDEELTFEPMLDVTTRGMVMDGFCAEADGPASAMSIQEHDEQEEAVPDPQRRLELLRKLGGEVLWKRQRWRIHGISKLVEAEREAGRKRSTEKTIRADLCKAADEERESQREGQVRPRGPFDLIR